MTPSNAVPEAIDVLDFWWQAGAKKWFMQNDAFDAECRARLFELHQRAAAGELDDWQQAPHAMLALIILLDQSSRNIFRGTPEAFAQDAKALKLAERAIEQNFDRAFPAVGRNFFYMPFMHAEDISAQQRCVDLFRALGDHEAYHYALIHLDAIHRFGRFPHRNAILGRQNTEAELRYLETGGFVG